MQVDIDVVSMSDTAVFLFRITRGIVGGILNS